MSRSVEFFGETIRLADEASEWAMLEFASLAGDTDSGEMEGLAAIMRLLKASVHPDDWSRFTGLARKNNAKIERDLMPVVVAVFEQATDRPTQRPSVSSDGPTPTVPSSTASSYSLEERLLRRPDIMVIVEDSQAAQRTA